MKQKNKKIEDLLNLFENPKKDNEQVKSNNSEETEMTKEEEHFVDLLKEYTINGDKKSKEAVNNFVNQKNIFKDTQDILVVSVVGKLLDHLFFNVKDFDLELSKRIVYFTYTKMQVKTKTDSAHMYEEKFGENILNLLFLVVDNLHKNKEIYEKEKKLSREFSAKDFVDTEDKNIIEILENKDAKDRYKRMFALFLFILQNDKVLRKMMELRDFVHLLNSGKEGIVYFHKFLLRNFRSTQEMFETIKSLFTEYEFEKIIRESFAFTK